MSYEITVQFVWRKYVPVCIQRSSLAVDCSGDCLQDTACLRVEYILCIQPRRLQCGHHLQVQHKTCHVNARIPHLVILSSLTLSANDVIFLPEYPMETGPHIQIVFTVQLPPEEALSLPALIPQPQLQSIVLINQAALEGAVGRPMVAVSAYEVHVASPSVVVPTVVQPTEEDIRNNAIMIILDRASITLVSSHIHNPSQTILILQHTIFMQWQVGDLESTFKGAVVAVASDHCSSNPASCNVETSSDSRRK